MWNAPKMAVLAEKTVLGISNHFPSLEFWADSWHFWQCSLKNHSQKFVLQSSQKLSFFAHVKPVFQHKIYTSVCFRLSIKILEWNLRKKHNEKMSLFFLLGGSYNNVGCSWRSSILGEAFKTHFSISSFFLFSSQPTSPIWLTAVLGERWNITWLNWNSLTSFPSLPFLVSILCLSGSMSLLQTRADGGWMLSQIQRMLCGHSLSCSPTPRAEEDLSHFPSHV